MRQALVKFHRLVIPMREAVSGLMRREHSASTTRSTRTSRTSTTTSSASVSRPTRCATSSRTIVETNLSLREYRTNQVMKKVTSWAAIIAVPTLITG